MNVWVLTGYSNDVGVWVPEVFYYEEDAEKRFNQYVEEYNASIDEDDKHYASCSNNIDRFWIEEVTVK